MDDSTASADPSTPDRPIALADESALNAFVVDHRLALVEFYTQGCGICASMEPVLGGVARTRDLAVGIVNPRDDPPLVERFDVRSVPLFVCFVDGEPVARRADGFVSGDELAEWVASKSGRSQ